MERYDFDHSRHLRSHTLAKTMYCLYTIPTGVFRTDYHLETDYADFQCFDGEWKFMRQHSTATVSKIENKENI